MNTYSLPYRNCICFGCFLIAAPNNGGSGDNNETHTHIYVCIAHLFVLIVVIPALLLSVHFVQAFSQKVPILVIEQEYYNSRHNIDIYSKSLKPNCKIIMWV